MCCLPAACCLAGGAWWQESGGRLAVLGSAAMFDDDWLAKEDNTGAATPAHRQTPTSAHRAACLRPSTGRAVEKSGTWVDRCCLALSSHCVAQLPFGPGIPRAMSSCHAAVPPAGVLDFLVGWMLRDPACGLSAKNVAEAEIVDPRPVTHIAELAAQPRVCLQVRCGAAGQAVRMMRRHCHSAWQGKGTSHRVA